LAPILIICPGLRIEARGPDAGYRKAPILLRGITADADRPRWRILPIPDSPSPGFGMGLPSIAEREHGFQIDQAGL
jgi:hypothetical protein